MRFNKSIKTKTFVRLIGFILLIYIFLKIDWHRFGSSIQNIQILPLVYAALLLIPLYILKSFRWKYLLSIQKISYSFKNTFLAFLSSNFIAFITPGRIGEVAKAFYVKDDLKISFAKSIPSVIIDRIYDMYILLAIGTIGLLNYFSYENLSTAFWAVLLLFLILPIIFLWKSFMLKMVNILRLNNVKIMNITIFDFLHSFYTEIKIMSSFKLFTGILLTIAAYAVLFMSGLEIIKAINLNIDYITIAIFISIANILSFIPISISGIGTRDASLIYLFSLINYSKEEALVFSTLLFFIFFVIGGLYGFICYLIKPINIKSIRSKYKT